MGIHDVQSSGWLTTAVVLGVGVFRGQGEATRVLFNIPRKLPSHTMERMLCVFFVVVFFESRSQRHPPFFPLVTPAFPARLAAWIDPLSLAG